MTLQKMALQGISSLARTGVFFTLVFFLVASADAAQAAGIFGISERPATMRDGWHVKVSPYWRHIMTEEAKTPSFTATGEHFRPGDAITWRNIIGYARQNSELEALRTINGFFNHWLPKDDQRTWNATEYWAVPKEFFAKRGGDCEDYAIAKYFALRYLGFPANRMRIVIVRELDPQGRADPFMHAVLAVAANNTWFILDNNARPRNNIFPHTQYKGRFVPVYSCNENGAWIHGKSGAGV
ncbi:MAG: hypothetical protein DELT_01453 [Desulfovibrio sp.]